MKKILIPVDFSKHTGITCRYALEMAQHEPAELRLFHACFDQIIIPDKNLPEAVDMTGLYSEEMMKELITTAEKNISEWKQQLEGEILSRKLRDITVSASLSCGDTELELQEIYQDFQPGLIVVGTTGKGQNMKTWGRVSTFIINFSRVPVMVVPEINDFLGFSKIMLAADLTEENCSTIKTILELFNFWSPSLFCVHFLVKSNQTDEKEKMARLREQFINEEESGRIIFSLREVEEDNQKSIDNFARDKEISLIVFQPYKHGILYRMFTRNITKKNLLATNIPLLAIPVK